jgi:hypothetical protein
VSYKFGCPKCKTVFEPNLFPSELQLKCPKCKTRQMRDISKKVKLTKSFRGFNDEVWDWQALEDRKNIMIDKKIEIFGPRKISDYVTLPYAETTTAVEEETTEDD